MYLYLAINFFRNTERKKIKVITASVGPSATARIFISHPLHTKNRRRHSRLSLAKPAKLTFRFGPSSHETKKIPSQLSRFNVCTTLSPLIPIRFAHDIQPLRMRTRAPIFSNETSQCTQNIRRESGTTPTPPPRSLHAPRANG